MNVSKWVPISLAASCATSLFPLLAQSQETEPATGDRAGVLEAVVVTARRRDEALQDVPISIVSKTGEYLEKAQVRGVSELSRVVPGFIFDEFEAGQQSTAQLRGLSSFAFQTHAPQSVAIVVDDVVQVVTGQAVSDFNDIERIEVLRGPQGTLFGRNTTGGVIHIVTKDPTDDFEAKISATYGSYNEVRWNGTINGALSENWSARASVFTADRDGHIENIFDGRMLGSEQQAGLSSKFLYTPREGTRLKLGLVYIDRQQQGRASPVIAFGPDTTPGVRLRNESIVGPENDKVNGIGAHPFDEQVAAATLTWNEDISGFELTSITAFEYWKFLFSEDADFRAFTAPPPALRSPIRFYVPNQLHAYSQELRLASPSGERVEYVLGLFATSSTLWERRDFLFHIAPTLFLFDLGDQDTEHKDYAVFGEADFHLTDTVTFTAGARWTYDETDVELIARPPPGYDPDIGLGFGPNGEVFIPFLESEFPGTRDLSISDSEWSGRVGLRWEPTSDLMLYTTVSRGFKGPTITALGVLGPVKSEIADSYEVGTKFGFWDNRATTSLAVFRSDVEDLQAQGVSSIPTPQGPITSIFLTNAAEVRTQGVEFELTVAPTQDFDFNLGVAYIDAEFEKYPGASCYDGQTQAEGCDLTVEPNVQDLSGRQMPLVPEWSGNAAVNYEFTVPAWTVRPFVRLDYNYQGKINWDGGLAPTTVSDALGILGLTLGIRSADDRLEVLGYVKNITDEFVVNALSGGTGAISAELPPEYQRTWGITVNYTFP